MVDPRIPRLEYWQWFVLVALTASLYTLLKGNLSGKEIALFSILLIWLTLLQLMEKSSVNAEKHAIFLIVRTERGKDLIRRISGRRYFWRLTGSFMVGAGVVAMFFMLYSLVNALYLTYFQDTPAMGAKLLIPGYTIPLWYGLLALVSVVVVHEISHGIVAKAEDVPVESLGVFFALAIPLGAFVEPKEDVFEKKSLLSKLRVYSAGSIANLFLVLLVSLTLIPLTTHLFFASEGLQIVNVMEGSPAEGVLEEGEILKKIKGERIGDMEDFSKATRGLKPGETVEIITERQRYLITTQPMEGNPERGLIGIGIYHSVKGGIYSIVGLSPLVLVNLFEWVVFLNLLVGLVNLLPIHFGIAATDGHHIFKLILSSFIGEVRAESLSSMLSIFIALIIIFNLIKPPM